MSRTNLKLVASQPPKAVFALRMSEAREAWLTVLTAPQHLESWFAWFKALERLEAERIRYLHKR